MQYSHILTIQSCCNKIFNSYLISCQLNTKITTDLKQSKPKISTHCNQPFLFQTCRYNSSASDLWSRMCPEKAARGGSGLNPVSSGATGTQSSIQNNPSNLTRIPRQARVRDKVTPSASECLCNGNGYP